MKVIGNFVGIIVQGLKLLKKSSSLGSAVALEREIIEEFFVPNSNGQFVLKEVKFACAIPSVNDAPRCN